MEATLLSAIGETFGGLGMRAESFPVFQRALDLRRSGWARITPIRWKPFTTWRWPIRMPAGSTRRSPSSRRRWPSEQRNSAAIIDDTIESMNDLAVAYWEAGQAARAIPLYEATL